MNTLTARCVQWGMILTVGLLPASFVSCDPVTGFQFERFDNDLIEYLYEDVYYDDCWDCWW